MPPLRLAGLSHPGSALRTPGIHPRDSPQVLSFGAQVAICPLSVRLKLCLLIPGEGRRRPVLRGPREPRPGTNVNGGSPGGGRSACRTLLEGRAAVASTRPGRAWAGEGQSGAVPTETPPGKLRSASPSPTPSAVGFTVLQALTFALPHRTE